MRITRDHKAHTITLNQTCYAEKLLNALVKRIVRKSLPHYLLDTVRDQMKAIPIQLFGVTIN